MKYYCLFILLCCASMELFAQHIGGGRGTVHECGDKQWRDSPVDRLPWHNKDCEFKIVLKFI